MYKSNNKDMKILLAGGIIDFYVNKKQFDKYKTKRGQFNYVYEELAKKLNSIKGKVINGIEFREVAITSNNFWGMDDFCIINDLGYCSSNKVPLNEEKITLRIFNIDLVGVVIEAEFGRFIRIKDENFLLQISNEKIV